MERSESIIRPRRSLLSSILSTVPFQLRPRLTYRPKQLERALQWQNRFYCALKNHPKVAVLALYGEKEDIQAADVELLFESLAVQSDQRFDLYLSVPNAALQKSQELFRRYGFSGGVVQGGERAGGDLHALLSAAKGAEIFFVLDWVTLLDPVAVGVGAKLFLTHRRGFYTSNQVVLTADLKRAVGFLRRSQTGRYTALSADLAGSPAIFTSALVPHIEAHPLLDSVDTANLFWLLHMVEQLAGLPGMHVGLGLSARRGEASVAGSREIAKELISEFGRSLGLTPAQIELSTDQPVLTASVSLPEVTGRVQVIIPFRNQSELLFQALRSLAQQRGGEEFHVTLVDNGSDIRERERVEAFVSTLPLQVQLVVDDGYFNYARLNNRAAALSDAPYILFLNSDVELTSVSAVQDLKSWCSRSDVGLVGAELRYPNGALQHCGISFTREGPANMTSLGCYPQALREVSGVSFACAMVKREVFTTLGGLDEVSCPNGFGDALFSHRVQEMGLSILVNPATKAVHHESATRGRMPEFVELFELAQAGVPLAEYWEEFHGSFQTTAIRYRLSGPLTQYLRWIPQFVNRALRRLLR